MKAYSLLLISILFVYTSCGVKGDPSPPLEPANIGRGKPSYKKVGKELNINIEDEDEEDEDE